MFGDLTIVAWFMGGLGMAALWIKLCADAEKNEHVNPLFLHIGFFAGWHILQATGEQPEPIAAEQNES